MRRVCLARKFSDHFFTSSTILKSLYYVVYLDNAHPLYHLQSALFLIPSQLDLLKVGWRKFGRPCYR